jgi:hypothetical protein
MLVTWQTIVTIASVLAAIIAIFKYYNKGYDWVKKQNEQDQQIQDIKDEQRVLTYGVLACLKGLSEQGCDGPVTDAIQTLEKHLNKQAHK